MFTSRPGVLYIVMRCLLSVLPLLTRPLPSQRATICRVGPGDDTSLTSFAVELERRGLKTAMDELKADGPSAFKNPDKVIEYVLVNLQHNTVDGIIEAFRFTAPPGGKQSFVSGNPLSAERLSWQHGKVIEGYASGRVLKYEAFRDMVEESYSLLLGCAAWSFAMRHPITFEPCFREAEEGFVKETTVIVDDMLVQIRLIYDWGSWCYLVYSVEVIDGTEGGGSDPLELGGAVGRSPGLKKRNQRSRGGNI